MWLGTSVKLNRTSQHHYIGTRNWDHILGTWDASLSLQVTFPQFILAVIKTSSTGLTPGWRANSAALFSALSTASFLQASGGRLLLDGDIKLAKDFIGMGTKGVIGAALAYLEATAQGYVQMGHWEDAFGPEQSAPDFILFKNEKMLLLEAKGTEQITPNREKYLRSQWLRQVRPNLAWTGADEGWLIGTCLAVGGSTSLELLKVAPPKTPSAAKAAQNTVYKNQTLPITGFSAALKSVPRENKLNKSLFLLKSAFRWLGITPDKNSEHFKLSEAELSRTVNIMNQNFIAGTRVSVTYAEYGAIVATPMFSRRVYEVLQDSADRQTVPDQIEFERAQNKENANTVFLLEPDGSALLLEFEGLLNAVA
jgi:hypothetical protein